MTTTTTTESEQRDQADGPGRCATLPPPEADPEARPAGPRADRLPPWKVLLHNDDRNEMLFVVASIVELAKLTRDAAIRAMLEAHTRGIALLTVTHRERAELLQEQFSSKALTVTIEPA
jgi:ATP-dependent Clp protease adaptor protein ClpS